MYQHLYGFQSIMMALRMSPQPIMIFGKTIQTDSYGVQSGSHETLQAFLCQIKSIGDHAPRITTAVMGCQPTMMMYMPMFAQMRAKAP